MTGITQNTALWFASRATGVVSLMLLTLVVILGILVNRQGRLPGLPAFAVTGLHRNISLLSVAFVAVHVLTAIVDPYVTIRLVAAVIPFTSGYEPFWLGLGAISVDLAAALILTSLIRARLPRRMWRGVHWLAYAAWPAALAHGVGAGPDLRAGVLRDTAIVCVLAAGAALLWRVTHPAQAGPRAGRAAAVLSSAGPAGTFPPVTGSPGSSPGRAGAHLTGGGPR
jgi:methionine sulfoxide reductase heme-binding subunit